MWMSYAGFERIVFSGTVAFPVQPPSGPSGSFALGDVFQWVEPGAGEPPRTYLIIEATFDAPIADVDVLIGVPGGPTVRDRGVHPFRHGYVRLTRRDGRQFPAGHYAIEIRASDGRTESGIATIDLDPAAAIPAAPLPDEVTGSNGQPVEVIPRAR